MPGLSRGDWGHAGASYRYYANDYGIPGGFIGGHPTGVDIAMRRHTVRAEGGLHLERGPFANVTATGTYTDYHHTEFEPSGAVGTSFDQTFATGEDRRAARAARARSRWARWRARAVPRHRHGRDAQHAVDARTTRAAGFLMEELGRGALRVQLGARYDWAHYAPHADHVHRRGRRASSHARPRRSASLSGSLGLLYEAADGVRLGASVNRAYRTPDFNELYSNGPHLAANSYQRRRPELKEETGLGRGRVRPRESERR